MCKILGRLKEFIDYKGIPVSTFEKSIGMSNASFGKQLKKQGAIGTDKLENILSAYPELSPLWLMTGEGEMLKAPQPTFDSTLTVSDPVAGVNYTPPTYPHDSHMQKKNSRIHGSTFDRIMNPTNSPEAIPLVSVKAVGGFAGKDFSIQEQDIEGYYVIPKFRNLNVDFLIEVIGDSMMPRFFPGDIIACSIIHNPRFIQWNKPYLIATREDGMIVKRLKPSQNPDSFLAVSDNALYDPFDIPKSDIDGLARVVGVIHAE
ncbi:MAG: helix-turn-helix transcriptional regulator [Bacteroides sp.]|nr:helix-turn-helix transcriptional regulator [Bacteroides sp.]